MSTMKMFSVYDSAAKAFLRPFMAPTRGMALRGFMDACSSPDHEFAKHASDYTLFEIGSFDEATGILVPLPSHERVASALELVSPNLGSPTPLSSPAVDAPNLYKSTVKAV